MTADRYTKVAIALHWAIAAMIVGQLVTGVVMGYQLVDRSLLFPMYQFHKSLGLTVLLFSAFRLFWRLGHRPPPLPGHMPRIEKLAARVSHYAFYIFMFAIPFSGWVIVSSSSFGLPTRWFDLFTWPHIPGIETLTEERKLQVNELSETAHIYMAYSLLALLALHIAAALKHHFYDKDEVLHHMIPIIKPKTRLPVILFALLSLSVPAQAAEWAVSPAKSVIGFSGENSGDAFKGKFEKWSATIDFDPARPETSSVQVEIDTSSAATGTKTYDMTLPQPEWFDVKSHPKAIFESKEIKSLGGNRYEAKGSLKIKDIAKDIVLPFTLDIKESKAVMESKLTIDRLDFDIGKKSDPKAEWVSKEIALDIHVEADQK